MLWSVALGSAIGGVCRFLLASRLNQPSTAVPLGTLGVNVSGSFLLGTIFRYAMAVPGFPAELRVGLLAGFCGGFTTFSSFSGEVVELFERGEWKAALLYVGASVVLCLAATGAGFWLGRSLAESRQS